jgi:hypothetical protein
VRTVSDRAALLVGFLNTIDPDEGTDLLDTPDQFGVWARALGFEPGESDAARTIRSALRMNLRGGAPASVSLDAARVPVRIGADGRPELSPATIVEAALAAAVELGAAGEWDRLKLCQADDCLEAFFDHSRNRSRVWCDMAVCGNTSKVRSYRQRAGARG